VSFSRWLFALAYLPLVGLLLLFGSTDPELRWHARNGQLLFGAVAAIALLATIIGILAPSLTCLYAVAMVIVVGGYIAIALLALVKAFEGERLMIPGISRHASRRSDAS
jgi:uncharacterized membrane protein